VKHPKVRECIVSDFVELDGFADQLTGYDARSYCAGASSRGMSEAEYSHVTYDVTTHLPSANTWTAKYRTVLQGYRLVLSLTACVASRPSKPHAGSGAADD
jgi:hypothetical protein